MVETFIKVRNKNTFYLLGIFIVIASYMYIILLTDSNRLTTFRKPNISTGLGIIRYENGLYYNRHFNILFQILNLLCLQLNLQEYSKNQIVGLINLVATMKAWKRKTRLEVLEKIESILS